MINDLVIQLEIKSREKSGFEAENRELIEKIKELEFDSSLYMKKINDLQKQQVDKLNEINEMYEET